MSKYGIFSGPYFPAFGLILSLRIQSECGKIRTRKNSIFGHVLCSTLVLNALKLNLDPANATCDSIVVQETCQLVSSELVTINIDVSGFTNTPRSIQVLQHLPNAADDFTFYDGNGASDPNIFVISAPNF